MSRHRGPLRALEPIKFCTYCREALRRYRMPSGRLERMADFDKRRFCSKSCANRFRHALRKKAEA